MGSRGRMTRAIKSARESTRRRVRGAAGFTLLEILVAVSILVVIAGIVYATFSGVTDATEMARADAGKLRLERFLRRNLENLFSSAYADPACARPDYYFAGTDGTGPEGPMDFVDFCSSAPMMGGMSLPGALKRVTIEVAGQDVSNQTLGNLDLPIQDADAERQGSQMLQVTETPLVISTDLGLDAGVDAQSAAAPALASKKDSDAAAPSTDFESPSWTVPIQSMDVTYFDGEDWVKEWDSVAMARLPWGVRIRINFARTPEEMEEDAAEGVDLEEDPDIEMVVPIPVGDGVTSEFIEEERTTSQEQKPGDAKPGNQSSSGTKPSRQSGAKQ